MIFTLTVNLDNAAFDDPQELSRILRSVADSPDLACLGVRTHETGVRDSNGNTVGTWIIEEA